jgi:hypothetical protein
VQLPSKVKLACAVTTQSNLGSLSNQCQVIAHIAPDKAGSIAQLKLRHSGWPTRSPNCHTSTIAAIHSKTLAM